MIIILDLSWIFRNLLADLECVFSGCCKDDVPKCRLMIRCVFADLQAVRILRQLNLRIISVCQGQGKCKYFISPVFSGKFFGHFQIRRAGKCCLSG